MKSLEEDLKKFPEARTCQVWSICVPLLYKVNSIDPNEALETV